MLDEYKEDFGTGIDDLQFDIPQENYREDISYTQQQVTPQQPPHRKPVPTRPVFQQPVQPEQFYHQPVNHQPIPAFQGPGITDPVMYEQPRYTGYSNDQTQSIGDILRSRAPRYGCIRTLLLGIISILIIGVSFWGSFLLGQKIFVPPIKDDFVKEKGSKIPEFLNPETRQTILPTTLPPEMSTPSKIEKIYVKSTGLKPKPTVRSTGTTPVKNNTAPTSVTYRVIAGTFTNKQNALLTQQQLREDGFETFIAEHNGQYLIQVGAFSNKNSAQRLLERALSFGYEATIAANN